MKLQVLVVLALVCTASAAFLRKNPTMPSSEVADLTVAQVLEKAGAANDKSFCFAVSTNVAGASTSAHGQQRVMTIVAATDEKGNTVGVTSKAKFEAGTYCCPGSRPAPGQEVEELCTRIPQGVVSFVKRDVSKDEHAAQGFVYGVSVEFDVFGGYDASFGRTGGAKDGGRLTNTTSIKGHGMAPRTIASTGSKYDRGRKGDKQQPQATPAPEAADLGKDLCAPKVSYQLYDIPQYECANVEQANCQGVSHNSAFRWTDGKCYAEANQQTGQADPKKACEDKLGTPKGTMTCRNLAKYYLTGVKDIVADCCAEHKKHPGVTNGQIAAMLGGKLGCCKDATTADPKTRCANVQCSAKATRNQKCHKTHDCAAGLQCRKKHKWTRVKVCK